MQRNINSEEGKAIIICAPSGSGKTTLVHRLISYPELRLKFSVSATTRSKRPNETDGIDYFFLSTEEFKRKIAQHEFIEWEEVYENTYYGTLRAPVEALMQQGYNVIFDVDVKGGLSLKQYFQQKALSLFVKVPNLTILEQRLRQRGTETEEKIYLRLKKASYEMTFETKFDAIIINDDLDNACQQALTLIKKFLWL